MTRLTLSDEFAFLTKARFWSMVIAGLAMWLANDGFISESFSEFLITVATGFTVINTLDRTVDKIALDRRVLTSTTSAQSLHE